MSAALPSPSGCGSDLACANLVENIPGTPGTPGIPGSPGTNGVSAFTVTIDSFTVPDYFDGAVPTVTIVVGNSSWAAVGQILFIGGGAGSYLVTAIPTNGSITVKNLETSTHLAYADNANPTTVIGSNAAVTPSGAQGTSGALTGTAGGDLEGTYPNPTSKITTTKGDLIVNNGNAVAPRNTRLGVQANYAVLHCDSAAATGRADRAIDLSGAQTSIIGAVPIANGGSGAITKILSFNALSPVSTRGDLISRDATNNVRLAVGAADTVLKSDGTDPAYGKVTPAMLDTTVKHLGRSGLIGSVTGVNLNVGTTDTSVTMAATKYIVRRVIVFNPSAAVSTASLGVFSAAAGGTAGGFTGPISADATLSAALTGLVKYKELTLATSATTEVQTAATLFVRVGTAEGSARTCDVMIFGEMLS